MKKLNAFLIEVLQTVNYHLAMKEYELTPISTLTNNATEYEQVMELIRKNEAPLRQVLHNGHIATELLIKALLMKYLGQYEKTHNLQVLCQYEFESNTQSIKRIYNLLDENGLRNAYRGIRNAWTMNDRYNDGAVNKDEIETKYNNFKEVIKWIQTQF